jgi:hypothetical protein
LITSSRTVRELDGDPGDQKAQSALISRAGGSALTDFAGLIFLAGCAVVGAIIVLALGHNPALERPAQTAPAD